MHAEVTTALRCFNYGIDVSPVYLKVDNAVIHWDVRIFSTQITKFSKQISNQIASFLSKIQCIITL